MLHSQIRDFSTKASQDSAFQALPTTVPQHSCFSAPSPTSSYPCSPLSPVFHDSVKPCVGHQLGLSLRCYRGQDRGSASLQAAPERYCANSRWLTQGPSWTRDLAGATALSTNPLWLAALVGKLLTLFLGAQLSYFFLLFLF